MTIVKPHQLHEQTRIFHNYRGKFGEWCKKAGNAEVEISGDKQKRQLHWYENSDGSIAGIKIAGIKIKEQKNGKSKI